LISARQKAKANARDSANGSGGGGSTTTRSNSSSASTGGDADMFSDMKKNRASSLLGGGDYFSLAQTTPPGPSWVLPGSFGLIVGALVTYMLAVSTAPEALLSMEDAMGVGLALPAVRCFTWTILAVII
jgi:hypothetical protein